MTIFLDVVKHFSIGVIEKYRKDAGGMGHDEDVTEMKRGHAESLAKDIWNFEENNDAVATDKLKKLITDCLDKVEEERGNYPEARFERRMKGLINNIDLIYKDCYEKKLVDLEPEIDSAITPLTYNSARCPKTHLSYRYGDPFDVLLYHAVIYFAKKILEKSGNNQQQGWSLANFITGFIKNPQVTSATALTKDKKDRLMERLEQCKVALQPSDKTSRIATVKLSILAIRNDNNELCGKHALIPSVPISVHVGLGSFGISGAINQRLGALEECMKAAEEELNRIAASLKKKEQHAVEHSLKEPIVEEDKPPFNENHESSVSKADNPSQEETALSMGTMAKELSIFGKGKKKKEKESRRNENQPTL
ncbi:hypothetical protein [Legionella fairfieldensis]|uniref:hypothetical protein n=1 Tax=Legionella fairfieldensis TaxID=45064 RepID=UPI00048E00A1|nr:hypothetical protein [Legionella fairfieldensis]